MIVLLGMLIFLWGFILGELHALAALKRRLREEFDRCGDVEVPHWFVDGE